MSTSGFSMPDGVHLFGQQGDAVFYPQPLPGINEERLISGTAAATGRR